MKWQKCGRIWAPSGETEWAQSHATLPIAQPIDGELWWVYVSCRDALGKSRIGRLTLDLSGLPNSLPTVSGFQSTPVLDLGEPGTFDESGVMPGWLVANGGELRLYYIGWNVGDKVPYRLSIGLAISDDGGGTFRRCSKGPIIDRSVSEPFFVTMPCVHKENDRWRMWYCSCTSWQEIAGRWEPAYHVKYAESADGIDWRLAGISCVDAGHGYAVAGPCVFRRGERYGMIYAVRSLADYRTNAESAYRLGYAESADGIRWDRMDERVGISRSKEGWDSEMMEYCWVQSYGGEMYMLYNGNGFGRSGFGMARLAGWD
jgi:hypothetical protein